MVGASRGYGNADDDFVLGYFPSRLEQRGKFSIQIQNLG